MKALTVRQPYAWAIAAGHKPVENRTRPTTHRGPLAIHAGVAWHPAGADDERVNALPRRPADELWTARGGVLAVADLVDCHQEAGGCCAPWGDPGAWHWVLAAPRPLAELVPATGRLGLWDIDLDDPAGAR